MKPGSLWRHRDFLKLWTGQTISVFGSQFTHLAVPLIAAVTLQASPAQMGALSAVVTAPLLAGLGFVPVALATPALAIPLLTPHRLQGRMNATMRFLVWGTMPLGALAGGALGQVLGLRATIAVAAVGAALASLWVWRSPVRALEGIPERAEG